MSRDEATDDWEEPTTGERARARAFGDVVDKVVAGRAPAAMTADDSPLVEVATVIRAVNGKAELTPTKQRAIVESALARAIDGMGASRTTGDVPAQPARPSTDVIAIDGWRRRAPWVIAGVSTALAAAAAVFLMMRGPEKQLPERGVASPTPIEQRSRPADALIGPIPRERSGDAVSRIDAIFADRLDGYRARTYGGSR